MMDKLCYTALDLYKTLYDHRAEVCEHLPLQYRDQDGGSALVATMFVPGSPCAALMEAICVVLASKL